MEEYWVFSSRITKTLKYHYYHHEIIIYHYTIVLKYFGYLILIIIYCSFFFFLLYNFEEKLVIDGRRTVDGARGHTDTVKSGIYVRGSGLTRVISAKFKYSTCHLACQLSARFIDYIYTV